MKRQSLDFFTIQIPLLIPPKQNIFPILNDKISDLKDGDIVFITTKILSIHQGNCVPIKTNNKDELAKECATHFIERDLNTNYPVLLTITQNCLISCAGIDESNANGYFILWPTNLDKLLLEIRAFLIKKFNLTKLGVVATDSASSIMKTGITGIAVACCGVKPIYSYVDSNDLFNRPFTTTKVNIIESITAMSVLLMGESTERTPIVIYRDKNEHNKIQYTDNITTNEMVISNPKEDIFLPLLKPFLEKK